jgi:hypothetical protein
MRLKGNLEGNSVTSCLMYIIFCCINLPVVLFSTHKRQKVSIQNLECGQNRSLTLLFSFAICDSAGSFWQLSIIFSRRLIQQIVCQQQ